MLYADFKTILKPVDWRYKKKMNTMKNDRKDKAPYTEKINTHIQSEWYVHCTFAYGDVPGPLKVYHGEDCVEKFVEYIEDKIKPPYARFSKQSTYWCFKKRTRGSKKLSHLPQRVQWST